MSDPSPSPPQQDPLQSDASPSLNEETPIQPDPVTAPPAAALPDPAQENSPGEEEDDDEEGEEIDEETQAVSSAMDLRIEPPITDPRVSGPDVTLASPTGRRGGSKRKKGKGKGKGKPNAKKLQAIEEKLQNLRSNLNPIPFIPHKILDFANHEKLLKKLGLWDFVHIDFDRSIRVDFIAQLVANYSPKSRCSYVNGYRLMVNRADLARSFKLPYKKEKAEKAEVDLDWEVLSDDSIGFIVVFVSDWVLLHEDDTWMMPNEVMDWMNLIKEGHPEKVDWAGLLWFMVEKELKQGGQLRNCFYASHLQHLIKSQRAEVFLMGEPVDGEVELGAEAKLVQGGDNEGNVKDIDVVECPGEERVVDSVVEGPSTELTLGQDGEKEEEEEVKEVEMMDAENCKDSDEEGGQEEQEQWLLNGKNNQAEHFIQRCNAETAEEFGSFEDRKDEEEEEEEEEEMDGEEDVEEAGNNFHVFPNDSLEGDGFTGNFLQGIEANQMGFSSQEQLPNASSVDVRADVQRIASMPSFFNNAGKRVIEHDYDHAVNDSNKRLRTNETWDNKPVDFGTCMEQIQQMAQRARMLYEEKEQAADQSGMNQQILLNELQKRDSMIEHLHKARMEETQKKDIEISRLERELYFMGSVLNGYRKALKEVRKAFAEYRERAQLPEESTYKDAGPGGLMLTAAEIERRRKKKEEEYKMNCLIIEQKTREVEDEFNGRFEGFINKINFFDEKLIGLEADAKELIALHSKKRIPETEEKVHQAAETLPVPEPNEPVTEEDSEILPVPESDEPMAEEVSEILPVPKSEEQVPEAEAEAADDPAILESDEKVVEVAGPLSVE